MVYGTEQDDLKGFMDADGASQEHRHTISAYVFMIDGSAVSWSSKKQELVTLSMAESEYVAATYATKEALWAQRLQSCSHFIVTHNPPSHLPRMAHIMLT